MKNRKQITFVISAFNGEWSSIFNGFHNSKADDFHNDLSVCKHFDTAEEAEIVKEKLQAEYGDYGTTFRINAFDSNKNEWVNNFQKNLTK